MGEERIELEKLNIVLFQSLAALFSAYIVSLFKDAEYTSQTIAILYLLHFVSFYISNIAYRFYSRGYLDELFQVLKYNVFFAVGITFTSFMLDGVFSISRRGMIYFFLFNTFSILWISCSRNTGSLFHRDGKVRGRSFWSQRLVGWKRYLIFCIHPTSIMEN